MSKEAKSFPEFYYRKQGNFCTLYQRVENGANQLIDINDNGGLYEELAEKTAKIITESLNNGSLTLEGLDDE